MKKTESLSPKVVFGGELEIADYLFLNKRAFFDLNKQAGRTVCVLSCPSRTRPSGEENKENINERWQENG